MAEGNDYIVQITWKNCFKVGVSLFLLYLCIRYSNVALKFIQTLFGAAFPLIVGCIIAYIVNITMSFYERHYFTRSQKSIVKKTRRPVCVFLAFLTLILIVVLVVSLIVPQLIFCVKLLLNKLPGAIEKLMTNIEELHIVPRDITDFFSDIDWKSRIDSLINIVTTGAGNVVNVVFGALVTVFSGVTTAVVSIIFSVYLLLAKGKLRRQFEKLFNRYLPGKIIEKVKYVLNVFDESFHRYFVAQCTEAVILGILCTLGMLIFRFPYAAMIGALIAFTALVPIVGAFIGAAVGAFMILTVSPFKALMFIIFIIVLQQIEENLIYPKVVGSSVNLPGIWVIAAITVGGGVLGIVGMLIAVPLVAAFYRILGDDVNKKQKA